MAKFTVLSPVDHDGKVYAIGNTIDLSAEAAKPLINGGAIEPAGATKAKAAQAEGDGGEGTGEAA